MHDYFLDADLNDFDDQRLKNQTEFDSGKQWSEYLDDYIEHHFVDTYEYDDQYWDDYFHRKR